MQDVELVDPGDASGDADQGSGTHALVATWHGIVRVGRWARPRWRAITAITVVTALAVVSVRVVRWRDERDYLASLTDRPGILAPLDASTMQRWRTSTGLDAITTWQAVGDVVIGAGVVTDGLRVVAIDATTGAVRWASVADRPPQDAFGAPPTCVATRTATLLVCVTGMMWTLAADGSGTELVSTRAAVTLDVATGTLVGRRDVAAQTGVAALDDAVVLAEVEADGHVHHARLDPVTWTETWTYDAPAPESTVTPQLDVGTSYMDPVVVAAAGRIATADLQGPVTVLSDTGELISSLPPLGRGVISDVDGHLVLYRDPAMDGTGGAVTDLVSGHSMPAVALYDTITSDGTLGASVLTRDASGPLGLVDVGADRQWTVPAPAAVRIESLPLLLRGQIVMSVIGISTTVAAYDGRTGALRWQTTPRRASSMDRFTAPLMTDGRVVLALESGPSPESASGAGWRLQAYDALTGHARWAIGLPDDLDELQVLGRHLYGRARDGALVGFG